MKRSKWLILGALALTLVMFSGIGTTWAYFTTYCETRGGYRLRGHSRDIVIEEDFSQWTKRITLENREGSDPVFVRAKVFAPAGMTLTYVDESGKWTLGDDGYYYYGDVLAGGESTEELNARIGNVPIAPKDGDSFDVVVVYESAPVRYLPDGTPYADWDADQETGRVKGWIN